MSDVLNKYSNIRYKNDPKITDEILTRMTNLPAKEQFALLKHHPDAGTIAIYHDPRFPEYVVEYVKGSEDDSVTTLYEKAPLFADFSLLVKARLEIMQEIAVHFLSLPSTLTAYDAGRSRRAYLKEFGTMQLLDLLARVESKKMIEESQGV
jgi:hypothetical protein